MIGVILDLEALPVDNGGACLVVLLLADPHLLEGGQRGQDGASDPDGVLPLRWGNDLNKYDGRMRISNQDISINVLNRLVRFGKLCMCSP